MGTAEVIGRENDNLRQQAAELAGDAENGFGKVKRGAPEPADFNELANLMTKYEGSTSLHPDKPDDVIDGTVYTTEADIINGRVCGHVDPTAKKVLGGGMNNPEGMSEYEQNMQRYAEEAQADVLKNRDKRSLLAQIRKARWAKAVFVAAMLFRAAATMDASDPFHGQVGIEGVDRTEQVG